MKLFLGHRASARWLSATVLVLAGMAAFRPTAAFAAPLNDNFSSATVTSSLPFSDVVDTTGSTIEPGEPTPSCGFGTPDGSVWYAFTPATSGLVTAGISEIFSAEVAAYTGASLTGLTGLGCRAFGNLLTIQVTAGQTYYFQVGTLFGQSGSLTFSLTLPPPPIANFYFYPADPSIFDTIQFYDFSSDPGGLGIQSWTWSFGDGATASGCCPSHRYATDAAYTVQETVTTPDGRTASTSQIVQVQTHDVAITTFMVPNTARTGQTKAITVGVTNHRYPETVQVQLLASVPGGFSPVGTLTQSVPVQKANGTVPFDFSYTFTSADAAIGTVTFEAVATIIGAPDALPADNTAISLPTKVSR